ncbi:site-specific recombinase XerD (plasmid) [Cylindrospermum stagnale PCC 7417]|uniref:Site-specific recombinase XerD n=1 Tax=Cylindrospermum stagnale PCC 7417 TaxID=56107 RepID=K9XAD3_9NOST|nr:site-specific integrase [Cylindrospermum stagnale]AFZ28572.1 site-specific recombinase XerD [Cylindrospermum stagnale PCC 7417]
MNEFEKQLAEIKKYNQPILDGFQAWSKKSNLSAKTIKQHITNIEFFAEYLVYYEPLQKLNEADEQDVSSFLMDWYPHKAMWASESSTKSYMSSFKKFFSYMVETEQISPDIALEVKDTLKEYKDDFLDAVSE